MNKVKSLRVLTDHTQKQMAQKLGLSEGQYRAKEKGRYQFTQEEMLLFLQEVRKVDKSISLEAIFFTHKPT